MNSEQRAEAESRRDQQVAAREHAQDMKTLDQLRALASHWRATAAAILHEEHGGAYMLPGHIPHELDVAIVYWESRALMSRPLAAEM